MDELARRLFVRKRASLGDVASDDDEPASKCWQSDDVAAKASMDVG